jgi:hypothetical protein
MGFGQYDGTLDKAEKRVGSRPLVGDRKPGSLNSPFINFGRFVVRLSEINIGPQQSPPGEMNTKEWTRLKRASK